ncbi:MAG: hypothetical protein MUF57_01160 [Gammaproteobacteria bacterium]|jgi:hypothetical protein|nr:hypothetical protein [Gammaproteobacteria bacterium]
MASAIDATKPTATNAYTANVRSNFSIAKSEIEALQAGTGLAANAVTNAKLTQMATQTIKGRTTASTGDAEDLTAAQARTIVEAAAPDVVTITTNDTLTKAEHQGKVLYCTTGALSLTVDNSTDFDAYASCEIVNKTGAVVTLVATATINRIGSKPLTLPANGRATLMREATADTYLLTGEMA